MIRALILIAAILSQYSFAEEENDIYTRVATSSNMVSIGLLPLQNILSKYIETAPQERKSSAECMLAKISKAEMTSLLASSLRSDLGRDNAELLISFYESDTWKGFSSDMEKVLSGIGNGSEPPSIEELLKRWEQHNVDENEAKVLMSATKKFNEISNEVFKKYSAKRLFEIKLECQWFAE